MSNNLNHYQTNGLSCRGFIYLIKNMLTYPVLWNKKKIVHCFKLLYTSIPTIPDVYYCIHMQFSIAMTMCLDTLWYRT